MTEAAIAADVHEPLDVHLDTLAKITLDLARLVLTTSHEQRTTNDYFLPGAFFLATAAFLGPLRVRALVDVRWPRTGRLRR